MGDPRLGLVVLLAVWGLVYARAATHEFVWDDAATVVDNPHYGAPLAAALRSTQHDQLDPTLLSEVGMPVAYESYRPLLFLSYALDDAWFGRSAVAMHAHGLGLGVLCIVAVWSFARRWLEDPRSALVVAAVFALHPLQTEVTCYVSARGDQLAALFALVSAGAFWSALAPASGSGRRAFDVALASVAFVASLAAKESAASLPVALAVLALARGRLRRAWLPLAALGAALGLYVGLRVALIGSELSGVDTGVGLGAVVRAPGYALQALRVFVLPYDLSIERPAAASAGAAIAGWVSFGGCGVFLLWRRLTRPATPQPTSAETIAAGLLWFGLLLAPAGIAVETMGVLADRYVFLSLFGAALAVGAGLPWLLARVEAGARPVPFAAATYGFALLVATTAQVGVWRDNGTLYTNSLLVEPESAMAHYRVGVLAAQRRGWPDALGHFEQAVRLDAENVSALNNLGVAYLNLGQLEAADATLRRALAHSGDLHFRAWNNLATVHFARQRSGEGCAALERSLRINPAYEFARLNHAHYCASDVHSSASGAKRG